MKCYQYSQFLSHCININYLYVLFVIPSQNLGIEVTAAGTAIAIYKFFHIVVEVSIFFSCCPYLLPYTLSISSL
jgi:hypothetical protein